ncbi:hypothetical protein ATCC90586_001360 [Pythium insidiosum]|nr:hypothetical protein ATCC90586_001360 [Pythium insidiosum]
MRRKSTARDGSVQQLHQQLSASPRLAIALCIAVCQWLCAAYLVLLTAVYLYVDLPEMTYYANLLALPATRRFSYWGYVHFAVALLHAVDTTVALLARLRRELQSCKASHSTAPSRRISDVASKKIPTVNPHNPAAARGFRRVSRALAWLVMQLFGRRGLLGIESALFDVVFSLRELVEMAAQCVQLYKYSRLLSRTWINDVLIVMFVIDCWDSLFLHWWLRDREALRRVVSLTLDALWMIGTNVVIPATILIPYVREVNVRLFTFSSQRLYVDQLFIELVTENRSVLALSPVDGISKIVPHVSIFLSLQSLRCFLLLPQAKTTSTNDVLPQRTPMSHQGSAPSAVVKSFAAQGVVPLDASAKPLTQESPSQPPLRRSGSAVPSGPHRSRRKRSLWVRLVHVISFLIGLGVLILHIRARLGRPMPGITCRMPQYPWFASGASCAIVEFNCYRQRNLPNESSLAMLDAKTVLQVLFTHCPALSIPTELEAFTNLLGMEIFNSTVVTWPPEAVLSANKHSQIVFFSLIRVNMTALPTGILHSELPPSLLDIEISISNLTRLPSDLSSLWHEMDVLYVEYSQLTEFPSVALELNPYFLSLVGNEIREIPSLVFSREANPLVRFTLSENPIERLPAFVNATINVFGLDGTLVKELPPWVATQVRQIVYAPRTPYCAG